MTRQRATVLAAAGTVLAVYVAVLLAMQPGAFYSPDEGAKLLQLYSLGWDGRLTYDVPYAGAALDPDYTFYPTRCRHEDLYPVRLVEGGTKLHWPIWFSLVTWLPYTLFGLRGLYVVPLLSGWAIALLSGWLVRTYDARLAPLVILAVGLGTPVAFFSLTHWEHTLASVLGLTALALVVHHPTARRWAWVAVALLVAAVMLRVELAAFAAAVAVAWALARRTMAAPSSVPSVRRVAVYLALAALIGVVAAAVTPAFVPVRHLWLLNELPGYLIGNLAKLPYLPATLTAVLIDAPGNQAPELAGVLRGAGLIVFGAAAAAPFIRPPPVQAAVGLAALFLALDFSLLLGLLPQPYISLHGFLPVAPFVVLAAWAFPDAWRTQRPDRLALTAAAATYLLLGTALLFTFTIRDDGSYLTGLEWGNRNLLTLYPLATVLAFGGLQAWRAQSDRALRRVVTAIALALLLCGVQMQARGLWVLYSGRQLVATWEAALRNDAPVVTDVWWLPAAMAPFFATHPMHCVADRADLETWLASAHARGVDEFTLASFVPVAAGPVGNGELMLQDVEQAQISGLHVTRYRVSTAH
jgi:hypothetical protein